jgi:hypothetical protein
LSCFLFCSSSSSSCADHSPLKIPAAALRDWKLLVRNLLPRARNFQMPIMKCRKTFCDLCLLSSRLFSSRDSTFSLRSSLDCRCNGQLSATPPRSSRLATAGNGRRPSSRAGAGLGRARPGAKFKSPRSKWMLLNWRLVHEVHLAKFGNIQNI